jgi:hypothetical protein
MFFTKLYLPVQLFFLITGLAVIACKSWLVKWGIDYRVLTLGNLLLFLVTFYSLYFYQRAMTHPSTSGFLRNTYSGIMIKLFACMIAVLLYALTAGGNINKGGLITCVILYLVYAILEMRSLLRWNKERKNA